MAALPDARITELLMPYLPSDSEGLVPGLARNLSTYLDLLLRWNARTNLTAIRSPEEIVRRHFGESLFTAARLRERLPATSVQGVSLLDFGSGAGFPGMPIQLSLPELKCTLAESQGKKAAFLREVVRSLGVDTQVWASRVESMPPERTFSLVTMRAVDGMDKALPVAEERVLAGGLLAILQGEESEFPVSESFTLSAKIPIPESDRRMLYLYARR